MIVFHTIISFLYYFLFFILCIISYISYFYFSSSFPSGHNDDINGDHYWRLQIYQSHNGTLESIFLNIWSLEFTRKPLVSNRFSTWNSTRFDRKSSSTKLYFNFSVGQAPGVDKNWIFLMSEDLASMLSFFPSFQQYIMLIYFLVLLTFSQIWTSFSTDTKPIFSVLNASQNISLKQN